MVRRLVLLLAAVASLLLAATPVLAATTYHYQERGSGLGAYYTNVEWDESGNLLPGSYFETYVDAASSMAKGDGIWAADYVCVGHWQFTIDKKGNWTDESGFSVCGEADTLAVDRLLSAANVVATLPVEECLAWDEETGECTEWISLGTLEVDLTVTGTGRLFRYHDTSSGGVAGLYQYTSHGNGTQRAATPGGSVTLDGASLIEGATLSDGWLFKSKTGYVEVSH